MEDREKLEIPTIEFTKVTLLTGSSSTCDCTNYECEGGFQGKILGCKEYWV